MRHIQVVLRHLAKGRAVLVHPRIKHLVPRHHKTMKHDMSSMMHQLSLGEGMHHKHHYGEGVKHHKVGHKKRALHYKL
jgi:hypothetical protein